MALPEAGYTQPVEIVIGGTLPRSGWVQPVEIIAGSGMVIGLPVVGGTPGSVLFVDAAGNLGQNNASFFWDSTKPSLNINAINGHYSHTLQQRFIGDGLVNDTFTVGDGWHRIYGAAANEFLDLTWYRYGASIMFRSARGPVGQNSLEFHAYRPASGNYIASLSVLTTDTTNQVQVRNVGDSDALMLDSDSNGFALFTESAASFDIGVALARYYRVSAAQIQFIAGTALAFTGAVLGAANTFSMSDAGGTFVLKVAGTNRFGWDAGTFYMFNDSAAILMGASSDCNLFRDGSGILSLRNTTNAQEFRVYGNLTGAKYVDLKHDGSNGQINSSSGFLGFYTGGTARWVVSGTDIGDLIANANARFSHGTSALATNATTGFFHLQSCAGAPTGTPASIPSGQIPMIVDSTNLKPYWYVGGAWKKLQVAGVDAVLA